MNSVQQHTFNTIVRKYPSHRDEFIKGYWKWLKGRRADDGAENLWRIHDKLYDLSEFVDRHPGGKDWLSCTKVKKSISLEFFGLHLFFQSFRAPT
jgi:hypothetical protein